MNIFLYPIKMQVRSLSVRRTNQNSKNPEIPFWSFDWFCEHSANELAFLLDIKTCSFKVVSCLWFWFLNRTCFCSKSTKLHFNRRTKSYKNTICKSFATRQTNSLTKYTLMLLFFSFLAFTMKQKLNKWRMRFSRSNGDCSCYQTHFPDKRPFH